MTLPTAETADALLAYLDTLVIGDPALPIAMPDVQFDAPDDGKYLRADFLPNAPAWQGLSGQRRRDQGLLQITVFWPRMEGLVKPCAVADAVKAWFPKGKAIAAAGGRITISGEPWATAPILEADKTSVPVTIPWKA